MYYGLKIRRLWFDPTSSHHGALVATVELLNGIEMTWVQFPYAPPIYGPIVIEAALFVRNERVGERYPAGPPFSMGA